MNQSDPSRITRNEAMSDDGIQSGDADSAFTLSEVDMLQALLGPTLADDEVDAGKPMLEEFVVGTGKPILEEHYVVLKAQTSPTEATKIWKENVRFVFGKKRLSDQDIHSIKALQDAYYQCKMGSPALLTHNSNSDDSHIIKSCNINENNDSAKVVFWVPYEYAKSRNKLDEWTVDPESFRYVQINGKEAKVVRASDECLRVEVKNNGGMSTLDRQKKVRHCIHQQPSSTRSLSSASSGKNRPATPTTTPTPLPPIRKFNLKGLDQWKERTLQVAERWINESSELAEIDFKRCLVRRLNADLGQYASLMAHHPIAAIGTNGSIVRDPYDRHRKMMHNKLFVDVVNQLGNAMVEWYDLNYKLRSGDGHVSLSFGGHSNWPGPPPPPTEYPPPYGGASDQGGGNFGVSSRSFTGRANGFLPPANGSGRGASGQSHSEDTCTTGSSQQTDENASVDDDSTSLSCSTACENSSLSFRHRPIENAYDANMEIPMPPAPDDGHMNRSLTVDHNAEGASHRFNADDELSFTEDPVDCRGENYDRWGRWASQVATRQVSECELDGSKAIKGIQEDAKMNEAPMLPSPPTIAPGSSHTTAGNDLRSKGDFDGALSEYRKALAVQEAALGGKEHHAVAQTIYDIAKVLHDKGNYCEASEEYRKAITIWQSLAKNEGMDNATAFYNWGNAMSAFQSLTDL